MAVMGAAAVKISLTPGAEHDDAVTLTNGAAGRSFSQGRCAARDAALPLVVGLAELHASVAPLRLAAPRVERAIRLGTPLAGEGVVGKLDRARIVRVGVHSRPLAFG